MNHNFDDDDLDALLRGDGDRLAAPPELWDSIRGRAKRRRIIKGSLAAAAVVVVLAGAVPAVIAVRDNSAGTGSLTPGNTAPPPNVGGPTSVPRPTDLAALSPETVSFVNQDHGWVSGPLNVDGGQISGGLATTTDSGKTWAPVMSNPAPTGLVRMSSATLGFSFGTTYQETKNGGKSWQTLPSPGYIEDLETNPQGRLWALVRSCVSCTDPRLFTATKDNPDLTPVPDVPRIDSYDAALTLTGTEVYVNGGDTLLRISDSGMTVKTLSNPCGGGDQAFASWEQGTIAAECSPVRGTGSIFESTDGGVDWTDAGDTPNTSVRAGVGTLAASTFGEDLIITTGTSAPYVSTDYGHSWTLVPIKDAGPVTFAAFISGSHVVGLSGGAKPGFVSSYDSGVNWSFTPFS